MAYYAGFKSPGVKRRVTPVSLLLENGKTYKINRIDRTALHHHEKGTYVAFVVATFENDIFELLYDVNRMIWYINTNLGASLFSE